MELFEERSFTPEFVGLLTRVQFCHGFLVAHAMDDSDDQTAHRGPAQKDISGQKRWLAEFLLPRWIGHGDRMRAFDLAATYCRREAKNPLASDARREFFKRMLHRKTAGLSGVFSKATKRDLERWVASAPEDSEIPG